MRFRSLLLVAFACASGVSFAQDDNVREGYCYVKPEKNVMVYSQIHRGSTEQFGELMRQMAKTYNIGNEPYTKDCIEKKLIDRNTAQKAMEESKAWNQKNGRQSIDIATSLPAAPAVKKRRSPRPLMVLG